MNRHRILADLADLVTELLDEVRNSEPFVRDAVGPYQRRSHRRRMARHHTRERGLLAQLDVAAVPSSGESGDDARAGKPTSRPPVTAAFELSCDIVIGASRLRRQLRTAAGKTLGRRQDPAADLREIVGLAAEVSDEDAAAALRQVRAWVSAARVLLGYDVAIVELSEVCCPHCAGPLLVRSDASSDVWCVDPDCTDAEGRRHTWPRSSWVFLLNELGDDEPSTVGAEEVHHG